MSAVKRSRFIHQLYEDGVLISAKKAWEVYRLDVLRLNSLITAIPREWRNFTCNSPKCDNQRFQQLMLYKNISREVYSELTQDPENAAAKIMAWNEELDTCITHAEFYKHCTDIYRVTNVQKFRSFQYRLLHRAIILNSHLYRWGIKSSNVCSFCAKSKETLLHFFVLCPTAQCVWDKFRELLLSYSNCGDVNLTPKNIIFNTVSKKPIVRFLCLIVKQYLYRQRCASKPINFTELKAHVRYLENIEKYVAIKNNRLSKHLQKWYPENYSSMVQENSYIIDYLENIE